MINYMIILVIFYYDSTLYGKGHARFYGMCDNAMLKNPGHKGRGIGTSYKIGDSSRDTDSLMRIHNDRC